MKIHFESPIYYFFPSFLSLSSILIHQTPQNLEWLETIHVDLTVMCANLICFIIFLITENLLSAKQRKKIVDILKLISIIIEISLFFNVELFILIRNDVTEKIIICQRCAFLMTKCMAIFLKEPLKLNKLFFMELIFILNSCIFLLVYVKALTWNTFFSYGAGSIAIIINYPMVVRSQFNNSNSFKQHQILMDLLIKSSDSFFVIKKTTKTKIIFMVGELFKGLEAEDFYSNKNYELKKSKLNTFFMKYDLISKSSIRTKLTKIFKNSQYDIAENETSDYSFLNIDDYLEEYIKKQEEVKNLPIYLNVCLKDLPAKKLILKITKMTYGRSSSIFFLFHVSDGSLNDENINLKKIIESNKRFFCSFSHELKTPINGSLPILENIYNMKSLNKEANSLLEFAMASLKLLHNSIDNIINFYLFESKQLFVSLSEFTLKDIIEDLSNIINPMANLKKLEFSIDLESNYEKLKIKTDYAKLKQILLNLLTNAVQFTNPHGNVKINIEVIELNPLRLKFSIIDSGIGMDEEKLSQLLDKLDNDDIHHNQINSTGSCFGLIICQRIAYLLGEKGLKIQSMQNKGSTFEFFINAGGFILENFKKTLISNSFISKTNTRAYSFAKSNTIIIEEMKMDFGNQVGSSYEEQNINSSHYSQSEQQNFLIKEINFKQNYNMPTKFIIRNSNSYSMIASQDARQENFKNKNNILNQFEDQKIPTIQNETESLTITKGRFRSNEIIKKNCECKDILAVDDDAFNLLSLEMICSSLNLKTAKALNGRAAIEKLKKKRECLEGSCRGFKLIFMDYQMPIMDGVEATAEICGLINNKEIDYVTIIGCTAFVSKDQVMMCLKAGMKDVIFKPITRNQIKNILEKWG